MATAKKYPEFELPPVLLHAIRDYMGPAAMSRLTSEQRGEIATLAQETAGKVGKIVDPPDSE